jgi:nitrogen fixation protein FixH
MTQNPTTQSRDSQELTGRFVLFCFLGFFGVVVAMNAVLIHAATGTFGGVETASAYKAGLAFNREIAAARAQEARHWRVEASLIGISAGNAMLSVTMRDGHGLPPTGVLLAARLSHPADARRDRQLAVREFAPGIFTGTIEADPGQWDLLIDVMRAGERLFRSRSRITLR